MNLKLLLLRPFNSKTFPTGSFIINTIQKATEKGKIYIHVHAERTYIYLRSYKHKSDSFTSNKSTSLSQ